MKLYNTLSRSIEEVTPLPNHAAQNQLGLYACGLTVYDYTHLGHLRKYTMDDVLLRALRHAGFSVLFVQNVTDVGHLASDDDTGEDKLEKGAKKYGKSVWDIALEFEEYFWRSMDLMGNLRPDVSCRATDHIPQQLDMVLELERRGYTYVIEGDGVYFDTSKLDDYGKLARLDIENLQEGARVQTEGKRNLTDFALWKFERPGENRAMSWPSPWAEKSFPGWHIECSAMSSHYLGDQFEIHTGGIDHIPVHHTNEIAQVEASTGKKPFVKYWVHHNFLKVEGEKMSKSLGNFFTIDDVLDKGFDPKALRLLFLTSHYRSEMNFTWDTLAGMQKAWTKLKQLVLGLHEQSADSRIPDLSQLSEPARQYLASFFGFLEHDLKTPEAVALMWDVLKTDSVSDVEKLSLLLSFDQVLGLGIDGLSLDSNSSGETFLETDQLPEKVQQLVKARHEAREAQDWSTADELRDKIAAAGYRVLDEQDGQKIKPLA